MNNIKIYENNVNPKWVELGHVAIVHNQRWFRRKYISTHHPEALEKYLIRQNEEGNDTTNRFLLVVKAIPIEFKWRALYQAKPFVPLEDLKAIVDVLEERLRIPYGFHTFDLYIERPENY